MRRNIPIPLASAGGGGGATFSYQLLECNADGVTSGSMH